MSNYVLEDNIEIPRLGGRKAKYPFPAMKIGQSFGVSEAEQGKIRSAAAAYSKSHGIKIAVRRTDDGSYRCWRSA